MKQIIAAFRALLVDRLSLAADSASEKEIIESIQRNVEFRGANLWSLIFAIFIASIGLNVNSTAVIIGAMLVSPLMGPIMGVGLGIGINDADLIRKALKSLFVAVIISIIVSTFYFFVSPLHDAQSELLARTYPTIWDVFIATFGGLAGIVGGTRREKGNVIPGVAIATALMPPLCTAGFGLAVGNFYYFLGAIYLFFINSVFICLSTFLVVRYMKLPRKHLADADREKNVVKYIVWVVLITALPSIYLAYRIVDKSIFESNANTFIKKEFNFKGTHIINKAFRYENGKKEIDLLLLGEELSESTIENLKKEMSWYKLGDADLNISQGLNAKQQIDFAQIKANILEEVFSRQAAEEKAKEKKQEEEPKPVDKMAVDIPNLQNELVALFPGISRYGIARMPMVTLNDTDSATVDTVVFFSGNFRTKFPKADQERLRNWLRERIQADSVDVVIHAKGDHHK